MKEPQFHTLDNGLRLALWPQSHLHSLGIGLYACVGPRFEESRLMGISHFLEHVLFRGNARYPTSLQMNRAFEAWGGSINAYTTREYTYFYGKLHPRFLEEGITFMSDLIHEPRFADIDLERQIILEERLQDVDPDGQILEEDDISREHFWSQHPLGYPIIGTPKSLRHIREQELKQHFSRFYGTQNLVLCLTGSFDPEQAIGFSQVAFEKLPLGQPPPDQMEPVPEKPSRQAAFVYHDSSQVSLLISFRAPAPHEKDFLPLLLLDRILDDGMSTRLWQRLVEQKGLCYDLWASIDSYSDVSVFEVGASVAPERLLALVEEIYKELLLLREEGPSPDEFEHAQKRWRLGQEFTLDKVSELNERLGPQLLYQRYIPLSQRMEQIEGLSRDDLMELTRRLFRTENHMLTAVGPLTKRLKRSLRELTNSLETVR